MNNLKNVCSLLICAAACSLSVSAQYPVIPEDVKEEGKRIAAEVDRKSDLAWEKALPVVLEEAERGRPYKPWASKPEDLLKSEIPAFPGAEGGGMYTAGGRGGKVLVVTSLEDEGPGTLREACETGGARIIVFNVSGVIRLKRAINVRAPYLTIAGQTAPGDGVCVTGESFLIDTHDVIIRHMRFRRGAQDVRFRDDALGGNAVGNIMLDHVSSSWGLDENMSMYRHVYNRGEDGYGMKLPTVNITIQNSIFSEALDCYNHAFGATIGGHNSMFARNLFASNISRNASVGMDGDFNFVNNVVFNWWNRSVDGGDDKSFYNIINNYYKPGPVTPKDKPIAYRILKPESSRDKNKPNTFGKAYVHGNIVEGFKAVTNDNWAGGVQVYNHPDDGGFESQIRVDEAMPMAPVTIMNAKNAYKFVLDNVGATFPKRDAVDARIVQTVKTGKAIYVANAADYEFDAKYVKRRLPADSYKQGIITDIRQVGGLPEYNGTSYLDSDSDGMPDAWELKYGLNPNDASDATLDCNGDGYTNIEKYINGIDPTKKVDWKDLKNNQDTLAKRSKLF
ncbi:polysaccharide lyase [Bacteroides sp. OttesenSCG-928-M17]|nr:polysaccharide lyase [Bacteroides sp. OttesenSCG-928-M17]